MDCKGARWAQIVFWERADLEKLHQLETWLAERLQPSNETRRQALNIGETKERALFREMSAKHQLLPFWPEKMPLDLRAERTRNFERAIYPLWASISARHAEEDFQGKPVTELRTLHTCDVAIFNSGKRPDRAYLTKAEEEKKAVGEKYRQANEEV